MTPGARLSAAIAVLDAVLSGAPAEQALLRWSRASRFAGSGDRAAVRDLVFEALRRRDSFAHLGGGMSGALTGRALMIGRARAAGEDPAALFTGEGHAPPPLREDEAADPVGAAPDDIPAWLRPRWTAALGPEAARLAQAMTARAPVWLRVNLARATPAAAQAALAAEGIEAEPSPLLASALRVTSGERGVARSAAYAQGLVELQDLSPQLAVAALPLAPQDRVLDYCAGGGGKALAIAARVPGAAIFVHDAAPGRMADLPARAARAGARIALTERPSGAFDLVVTDVPCSGSGTWRRTPDAKWRLTETALARLLEVQAQILDRAAPLVRPGGHLAYMTCSLLKDENGRQIEAFRRRSPGFALVRATTWTPLTASDGFHLTLLRRQE